MLAVCKEVPVKDGEVLSKVFEVGKSYWFSQNGINFEYFKGSYKNKDNTYKFAWKQFYKCFQEDLIRVVRSDYQQDVDESKTKVEWCNCHYCGEMFAGRFHNPIEENIECPNCHSLLSISERN